MNISLLDFAIGKKDFLIRFLSLPEPLKYENWNLPSEDQKNKRWVRSILKEKEFSKRSSKLIKLLSQKGPLPKNYLEKEVPSDNIISLVRDTRVQIKKFRLNNKIKIIYSKSGKTNGKYKLVFSPFIED